MKLKALIFTIITAGLCACAVQKQTNFFEISVPEEGGISFVKYTNENDDVLGPVVLRQTDQIRWYAPSLISVSPSGEQLAFLARKNNTDNIFLKNTKGGGSTIQRTFRNNVSDMSYSPSGERIVFTDEMDGNTNVYMINATQGSAIQQITSTPSNELGPAFSPNGNEIFFTKAEVSYSNNIPITRYYVWSYSTESSLLTQYTEGFTPSVAPDGENLIVTRNSKDIQARGEIWMINLKTGQSTLILADKDKGFSSPQVSPDGETIVLVGESPKTINRRKNLDIYTIKTDGTKFTQITFHPGDDVSPVWSPDGNFLYFISQRGNEKGEWNVWKMNVR
ncbi:MAG: hypothetical protein Q7J34_02290 [Bacteroidales bacterium]|jgi:Tol biopolymer transport system component|nr:hypothetical protein [Bacteroidales bacterium]